MPLPQPLPEGTTMLPKGTFAGQVVGVTGGGTGWARPSPWSSRASVQRSSF